MKNIDTSFFRRVFLLSYSFLFVCYGLYGQDLETEHGNNSEGISKAALMSSSSFIIPRLPNYVLDGLDHTTISLTHSVSLPEGAVITNIQYSVLIDDNSNIPDFYPWDYLIYLSSDAHAGTAFLSLYEHEGTVDSHGDMGGDDDTENDTDIELILGDRSTSAFNGEDAAQGFQMTIWNTNSGGEAIIKSARVKVYWEAPDPNLRTNYTPTGWSAPIVANHSNGSTSDASTLFAGVTTYLNFSYRNDAIAIPSSSGYPFYSLIDDDFFLAWDRSGANENTTYTFTNKAHVFTVGEHEVCQRVDFSSIVESNESDNYYCRTLNWVGAPNPPVLSAPSNGAGCQNTSITLDWDATNNATSYSLQVDNDPSFSSPEPDLTAITTTHYPILGLNSNTIYYWRVRAINPAGASSYSSVRNFTTSSASGPAAPSLDDPPGAETCQPTTINLSWHTVTGASDYNLQVDNNSDFSSPAINQSGITVSEKEIAGLLANERYYWRVAAVNDCGTASTWSSSRDFTTAPIPGTPTLSGPANGAGCQTPGVSLSWNALGGVVSYQLMIDNNSDFSSPEYDENDITSISQTASGLSLGTSYFWRLRALNSCNAYSSWSSSRSFTTSTASPGIATPSTPILGAACQPLSVSLSWEAGTNASAYAIQLDDNDDFGSCLLDEGSISVTSYSATSLSEGTTYYWRTKPKNACGAEGVWSASSSFTTLISSIDEPVLSGPANAETCMPTSPTLSWTGSINALEYILEVDNNDDFSSPEYTENGEGTSQNCSELNENSTYYWRVYAMSSCSVESDWSAVRSFTTGTNGMDAPSLALPANNSNEQELSLSFSWSDVSGAVSYQFQIDNSEDFSSPLYDEEETGVNTQVSSLDEGVSYYWQVRANGNCATGDWSETWQFVTIEADQPDNPTSLHDAIHTINSLGQNNPNPFMETTNIEFSLEKGGQVIMEIFDLQGKLVDVAEAYYTAGSHSMEINLSGKVCSGVYIYRMKTTGFTDSRLCVFR